MDPEEKRAAQVIEERVPGVIAAWIHGSRAAGREHASSDVDVAVLAHDPLPPSAFLDLAAELSGVFAREVDLMDLWRASTVARVHVLDKGRLLLCSDDGARRVFETYSFSSYARLNEERAGILRDIAKRGSIHG